MSGFVGEHERHSEPPVYFVGHPEQRLVLCLGEYHPARVSRTVPVPPGIFVIWDGMGLVAKRIEHVPHSEPPKVVLKSLNPEYDSYERLAEEIRVVGRAVWVSRRL